MGSCLCLNKNQNSLTQEEINVQSEFSIVEGRHGNHGQHSIIGNLSHANGVASNHDLCLPVSSMKSEPNDECIDRLVRETLSLMRTLLDNEQDPPISMLALHKVAERDDGWLKVVKSLIRTIPLDDPLGPDVITLLLAECPLCSKSLEENFEKRSSIWSLFTAQTAAVSGALKNSIGALKNLCLSPCNSSAVLCTLSQQRNMCIVLGYLSERQAGVYSVSLMSSDVLSHLVSRLNTHCHPAVVLHALIALEKFAQTSENKVTISQRFAALPNHPLLSLQVLEHDADFQWREVAFCARWCLDNVFVVKDHRYTYELLDLSALNVMLSCKDATEYLKISPDGLQARCDAYSFESVRCTCQVDVGVWFYEVLIITDGVMQIGWATMDSKFVNDEGQGVGDDEYSMSYDGCRQLLWYKSKSEPHGHRRWKAGDVLGLLLDIDKQYLVFYLNGDPLPACNHLFHHARVGFFPAASFMSFQQCQFNFGAKPFVYPPSQPFNTLNQHGVLTDDQRTILPRQLRLKLQLQESVAEDSCMLCVDAPANTRLLDCGHQIFCDRCASKLVTCPLCRQDIRNYVQLNAGQSGSEGPAVSQLDRASLE